LEKRFRKGSLENSHERCYTGGLTGNAEKFSRIIRNDRSTENNLHRVLDAVFGENVCKPAKVRIPENPNIPQKLNLSRIKHIDPDKKRSFKRQFQNRAALWSRFETASQVKMFKTPLHNDYVENRYSENK
jgi:predicted transposase YbfD/YdcC